MLKKQTCKITKLANPRHCRILTNFTKKISTNSIKLIMLKTNYAKKKYVQSIFKLLIVYYCAFILRCYEKGAK